MITAMQFTKARAIFFHTTHPIFFWISQATAKNEMMSVKRIISSREFTLPSITMNRFGKQGINIKLNRVFFKIYSGLYYL